MKHLYLLPLAALICACTGQQADNDEQVELNWGTAKLSIENPIAPGEKVCYQIKIELDTLAGENALTRQLASVLRDSVLNASGRETIQAAMVAFADSMEAEWKAELAETYDVESEYKDMFQYYYSINGSPVEEEQDSIVSYQTTTDCYLGGAHGSYVVQYYNFDKASGKLLSINDIVPADKEKAVLKAMAEQLCEDWEAKDLADLQEKTGITMLGDLYLTDNFLFKGDSILFLFNQYEIAPYAAGLISVTVEKP
ncbi:MAG: RsiV family protein [Bacteroidaceae bacterium]|nr:RsiV family protein [Bacteroidaceae bacterium]